MNSGADFVRNRWFLLEKSWICMFWSIKIIRIGLKPSKNTKIILGHFPSFFRIFLQNDIFREFFNFWVPPLEGNFMILRKSWFSIPRIFDNSQKSEFFWKLFAQWCQICFFMKKLLWVVSIHSILPKIFFHGNFYFSRDSGQFLTWGCRISVKNPGKSQKISNFQHV